MKIEDLFTKYTLTDTFNPGEPPMISVRDGWADLLDRTFEALFKAGWDGRYAQVKQKFGALRIYLEVNNPDFNKIIADAEGWSHTICEFCGSPGNGEGGYNTTCGGETCNPWLKKRAKSDA